MTKNKGIAISGGKTQPDNDKNSKIVTKIKENTNHLNFAS
jgi:hypothetical protein